MIHRNGTKRYNRETRTCFDGFTQDKRLANRTPYLLFYHGQDYPSLTSHIYCSLTRLVDHLWKDDRTGIHLVDCELGIIGSRNCTEHQPPFLQFPRCQYLHTGISRL